MTISFTKKELEVILYSLELSKTDRRKQDFEAMEKAQNKIEDKGITWDSKIDMTEKDYGDRNYYNN
tara:strand:+ start:268 stop:465 length:198 start_codon:yes stop_codon:yes gene_type:complete